MCSTDDVYELINYTSFVESLFIAVSVAGLLYLRYKEPDRERPIKVRIIRKMQKNGGLPHKNY